MPRHTIPVEAFRTHLLAWYQNAARPMPWRKTEDAYRIWLAEIMLQQTTVATVIPYYTRFLQAFPTVQALANADIEEVLHLWQGLGYYRRAHLLHACAKGVVNEHGGTFPTSEEGLLALPGIGPYTAAAIAATAFNRPATVVDGNVERVIARLFRIQTPLPKGKKDIRDHAATLTDPAQPRAYANAIMELGATVCTPTSPACTSCPVAAFCSALQHGDATTYPRKSKKKPLPTKHATAYVLTDPSGAIYLHKRGEKGMLSGLWEVPHTGWENVELPFPAPATKPLGTVRHTFTHFHLTVEVVRTTTESPHPQEHAFAATNLPPLPTLMKKVLQTAGVLPQPDIQPGA